MNNLTVVIPYYNGQEHIGRLLSSLPSDLPVIIVDDCSEPPISALALLESGRAQLRVIKLESKGYFAGAVNAGVAACATDVLILNQDTWFEGDGWQELLEENRMRYALIGERIKGEHPAFPQGYVHGTFMFIRRDAWKAVGPLNAELYPLWGNTAEWQLRAARKGFEILPVADVPGFRHARPAGERYGSSIAGLLSGTPALAGTSVDAATRARLTHTPPLVSVVVPCHNYARYLPDCIHSLIGGDTCLGKMPGQTLQSFEVIIVDDASTDDTPQVGAALANDWQGIRYIRLDENAGTAGAVNTGVRASCGQYVTFLSADDMREPGSLAALVAACEANPHTVACDDVWIFGGGKRLKKWAMQEYDFETLLTKNHIHAGILYPRRAWEEVGGYPAIMRDGREDWAYNVALGRAGWCVTHVRECNYLYRREGQNRTLHNTNPKDHARFLAKIQGLYPELYRGERPMACCGGGRRATAPRATSVNGATAMAAMAPGASGMVQLEYTGAQMTSVWSGQVTNISYRFGKDRRIGWVDRRDVGERDKGGFLSIRKEGAWLFRPYTAPAPAVAVVVEAAQEKIAASADPAALIDPSELTVAELRALPDSITLSGEEWSQLLENEKTGKARPTAIRFLREKAANA